MPSEMYFQKPQQLLNVFADLEEENLRLIQAAQDSEEQLEELKKIYTVTKQKMDNEAQNLKDQIDLLNVQIKAEEEKAEEIKKRAL